MVQVKMKHCPECKFEIAESMGSCPQCGYPFPSSDNPYQPPATAGPQKPQERLPHFQYGLSVAALPLAMVGITSLLKMQGLAFSDEVLGFGTIICMLPALALITWSGVDRFFLHRNWPLAKARVSLRAIVLCLIAAAIWLLVGMLTAGRP